MIKESQRLAWEADGCGIEVVDLRGEKNTMKRSGFGGRTWLGLGVSVLVAFGWLRSNIGLAYEREVVLPEQYQTESEKETLADRFSVELSVGMNLVRSLNSYRAQAMGISDFDQLTPQGKTYLDRLGLEFSKSTVTAGVGATYLINPRTGVFLTVPGSLVHAERDATAAGPRGSTITVTEDDWAVGIGDVSAGISYGLLLETETSKIPTVNVQFEADSDLAKYYSLGDGVWGFTPGVRVSKFLTESYYLFGTGSYTYKMEKNGAEPGDVIGYGGGIGFLMNNKQSRAEIGLTMYSFGESTIDGQPAFEEGNNLVLRLGVQSVYKGGSVHLVIGGLNHGFSNMDLGLEMSFAIL